MESSHEKLDAAVRAVARLRLPVHAWRFEIRPWRAEVWAEDDTRETLVAAGAAMFVLAVELRVRGCAVSTEFLPGTGTPALVGTVRLTGLRDPAGDDRELAAALGEPAPIHPPTEDDRRALEVAAAVEGARLCFPDPAHAWLCTRRDDRFAELVAGLALARVRLTAASRGVGLCWAEGTSAGEHVQAVLTVDQARVTP